GRKERGRRARGAAVGVSQLAGEAGGSLTWEASGRVGSSPDNDEAGRHPQTAGARQARRRGVRVQEQVVEPPQAIRRPQTWWTWAGQQRTPARQRVGDSMAGFRSAGLEATGKGCGVPVARLQGNSWTPIPSTGSWGTWG